MIVPRHVVAAGIPQQRTRTAVVEQAKGALMLLYGLEAPAAQSLLQEWSCASGYGQVELSEALLYGVSPDGDTAPPEELMLWLTHRLRCAGPAAPALPEVV
jgi:hypothetical protein